MPIRLTTTEKKIVPLARGGLTNAQIAERLRTTKDALRKHLTRIHAKGVDLGPHRTQFVRAGRVRQESRLVQFLRKILVSPKLGEIAALLDVNSKNLRANVEAIAEALTDASGASPAEEGADRATETGLTPVDQTVAIGPTHRSAVGPGGRVTRMPAGGSASERRTRAR